MQKLQQRTEAELLSRSLSEYIRAAWPVVEPVNEFVSGWHIDAMCEYLEAATRGEVQRLIINVPPGHMKSLTTCVFWPTWMWTQRPETRWLCGSHSVGFATRDSLKCRRLIESEWYREHFGKVFRLTTDQNVKTWFENDKTGYRYVFSPGGGGTGMRADIIVFDDPIDIEDRNSEAARAAVIELQDMTLTGRFGNQKTGVEVVVMQRVHEDDLSGHLLAQGGWEHLCLPAEYEPSHPFVWPDDKRTEPGELLWPEHIGPDELAKQKVSYTSTAAAGMLQQRPAPAEGSLLKRQWWRYFDLDFPPVFTAIFQSWDTAFKDKTTSDYVVGQAWATQGANRYLLRSERGRWDLPETMERVRQMWEWVERRFPNHPHSVLVENSANGPEVIARLRSSVPGLIAINVNRDKQQRAHAVAPLLEGGNVFVPAQVDAVTGQPIHMALWVRELIDECATFPNAANDDQVDAMTQALNYMRGQYVRTPKTDDALERNGDRRMTTAGLDSKVF